MAKVPYTSAIGSLMYAMICYPIGHCTFSESCEQVHEQPEEVALGGSEMDPMVSKRNYGFSLVFQTVGLGITRLCRC